MINYLYVEATSNVAQKLDSYLNYYINKFFIELFGFIGDCHLELIDRFYIKNKQEKLYLHYSQNLKKGLYSLEDEALKIRKQFANGMAFGQIQTERARVHSYFTGEVNKLFGDDLSTYYIPSSRNLMTVLTNQKTVIDYKSLDYITREFMQCIESIQSYYKDGISKAHLYCKARGKRKFNSREVAHSIIKSLSGDYYCINGREFLITGNKKIGINYASAWQQESLWIFNLLYTLMLMKQPALVIIEEPWAYLSTTLMEELLQFIELFQRVNNSKVLIIIGDILRDRKVDWNKVNLNV